MDSLYVGDSPELGHVNNISINIEGEKAIAFVKRSIAATPLGRPGNPQDLADAAMFLATCEFATGQVIEVDGGWTAT